MTVTANPEADYLIAQRAKVIAKLSQIAITIAATTAGVETQHEDEVTYSQERGGDLPLLKLKQAEEVKPVSSLGRKGVNVEIEDVPEDRRQNRRRRVETDYSIILDADVFSPARKGQPIDQSAVGIGGAAEEVMISW